METYEENMLIAVKRGETSTVKNLLKQHEESIHSWRNINSTALKSAIQHKHLEIVRLLIPVSDPLSNQSEALSIAAACGRADMVKLLIPVSDPKEKDSFALTWAAQNGHLEVVKLLVEVSDPRARSSRALIRAALEGHTDIVKFLIPLSDLRSQKSQALQEAVRNKRHETVKVLAPMSDANEAFDSLFVALLGENKVYLLDVLTPYLSEDNIQVLVLLTEKNALWLDKMPCLGASLLERTLKEAIQISASGPVSKFRM